MGEFIICSDNGSNSTLIPNRFIDVYMEDANDAQIKTYLYLVRMMAAGKAASIQQMADTFNHTEKEVVRSLRYWEKRGLLLLESDGEGNLVRIHLRDLNTAPAEGREAEQDITAEMPSILVQRPQTPMSQAMTPVASLEAPALEAPAMNAAAAADTNTAAVTLPLTAAAPRQNTAAAIPAGQTQPADPQRRSELFFIVEQYIGKPLSPLEMQKINYIADDLHFSDDLIDFLVQYCVGNGKKDFRYIEKVAMNWAQEGISTTRQARENVARGPQKARRTRKRAAAANSFNQFSQNEYNFEELEQQILNN